MPDVSEVIDDYSQALEQCRSTLHAEQQYTMDRMRREKSTPLRVRRKWTNYSTLSDEELIKHKESLLEGIFHDYITDKVRKSMSAEMSDTKTEVFLGDGRISGVTVYLPKPITTLLGTEQDSDYETARVYHHRIIDNALRSDLSRQARQYLDVCRHPYADVEQSADGLASDIAVKMRYVPLAVSAKESWIASALDSDIDDILEVFDSKASVDDLLDRDVQLAGKVLAEVEEPARALSLDWIREWTDEKRTDLYDEIVESINKYTPGLDPSEVEAQAKELSEELIGKQWSEEEEQHQKALDRLSAYFTKRPPSDDYASSVDLFPIVFEHNLKDDATGKERATDPNGVKTVLTTGGEGNRSLESFLPPAFSELLSQA